MLVCLKMLATVLYFLSILVHVKLAAGQTECKQQSCSKISGPIIRFPFRQKDRQPHYCGYPDFVLSCNDMNETVLELPAQVKMTVNHIDYYDQVIELYDPNNCFWKQVLTFSSSLLSPFQFLDNGNDYTFFNCSSMLTLSDPDINMIPCLSGPSHQVFAIPSYKPIDALPLVSCTKMQNIPSVQSRVFSQDTWLLLTWPKNICGDCEAKGKNCRSKTNSPNETECFDEPKSSYGDATVIQSIAMVPSALMLLLVPIALCHNSVRKESEFQERIKKYLKDYETLKPTRYPFTDIKRITNQFKEKLGQGAYGTVYKGKLSDGIFVAVKILSGHKGNGEEFINEVRTVGMIHHVNVVRLVGFCADGFRQALVYEYLPNGSLEKFIVSYSEKTFFLGWEKLQDIALGTAKGIEYLHQGCHQTILHFDIKPHNVLLDKNFNPKVSDFGLAKFCSKDKSNISMTRARGTIGYIAPEVFSRNFGKVSPKSDVYGIGMVLLDMIGGRKAKISVGENDSNIYFPDWIYNFVDKGEDLRIQIEEEADAKIARKLAIVGLWCIQWNPADRPTMKAVVQMLEREVDELTVPPNPYASTIHTSLPVQPEQLQRLDIQANC